MSQSLVPNFDLQQQDSLQSYLNGVSRIELLSPEKELEIARLYISKKDTECARQLVVSNLRYVVYIAKEFMGYGLPLADLIQQGNIGLMKAVKRYDPEKKVRVITFATKWIKSEIYEYLLHNWRIVRMATTKAQRKLFFNLRKLRKSTGWMKNDEVQNLAQKLELNEKDVRDMEVRLQEPDVSFEYQPEEGAPTPLLTHADYRYSPEKLVEASNMTTDRSKRLEKALSGLDERSKNIIYKRWLNPTGKKESLQELAKTHHVSMERIRQIEKKAMTSMREVLVN